MKKLALLLAVSAVLTGYATQDPPPWAPGLQPVPEDSSPVLTPEQAMKTFHLPPGYRLELVASEPMIEEPVAIDWDANGRLWVLEMPAYMRDLPGTNEREPSGRVSVLEDTNGDGKMDKATVFKDGLNIPCGVVHGNGGVYVTNAPDILFLKDTDGDDVADTEEVVLTGFGRDDTHELPTI